MTCKAKLLRLHYIVLGIFLVCRMMGVRVI